MEGLVFYADLLASWVENLSSFWGFLNTNVIGLINSSINSIGPYPDNNLALAMFQGLKSIFFLLGFEDLTVLGFLFSVMGFGFGIYFVIVLIRWVLDILP